MLGLWIRRMIILLVAIAVLLWPQTAEDSEAMASSLTLSEIHVPGGIHEPEEGSIDQPTVYITFDDGPTILTPKVLDILKEHEVTATFFVLGELAEKQEDIVRRIAREGHALGNHTYNHRYDELYRSFASFWDQVERTNEVLARLTGQHVTLFRAPGGTATNFDAFYFYYMEAAGYSIFDWTVDSGDSKRRNVPAAEIVANVKRATLTHEMNVLLHDGAGHAESVKALPEIIQYFKEKGYRFAALQEDVKPVMFQVKDVKWDRSITIEDHEQLLAMIGERTLSFSDEWIPLRDWAEQEGVGTVAWNATTETATLQLGDTALRMNVRTGIASEQLGSGSESPIAFPFKLKDERIYILKSEADQLVPQRAPGGVM